MSAESQQSPSWDRLFEVAVGQEGHFTTRQAADAGYSPQLLIKYLENGRITRVRRGVYRMVHFPAGEHEDLVTIWLWSERAGVFSHETALMLHDLSDALPRRVRLTLPANWAKRRLRVPRGVLVHHAEVPKKDLSWVGPVPITTPLRTIVDCVADAVVHDFVRQAVHQGIRRGLFERGEVNAAVRRARKERDAAEKLRKP